jgi:hypothetical protein
MHKYHAILLQCTSVSEYHPTPFTSLGLTLLIWLRSQPALSKALPLSIHRYSAFPCISGCHRRLQLQISSAACESHATIFSYQGTTPHFEVFQLTISVSLQYPSQSALGGTPFPTGARYIREESSSAPLYSLVRAVRRCNEGALC